MPIADLSRYMLTYQDSTYCEMEKCDNGEYILRDEALAEEKKLERAKPTLVECQAHVQRLIWSNHIDGNSMSIVETVYNYMTKK